MRPAALLHLGGVLCRLFYAEAGIPELGYGSAINTFCAVIPFIFYAIAAVALVPLFSLGLVPKLGRMKKAYRRVEETGKVYSRRAPS